VRRRLCHTHQLQHLTSSRAGPPRPWRQLAADVGHHPSTCRAVAQRAEEQGGVRPPANHGGARRDNLGADGRQLLARLVAKHPRKSPDWYTRYINISLTMNVKVAVVRANMRKLHIKRKKFFVLYIECAAHPRPPSRACAARRRPSPTRPFALPSTLPHWTRPDAAAAATRTPARATSQGAHGQRHRPRRQVWRLDDTPRAAVQEQLCLRRLHELQRDGGPRAQPARPRARPPRSRAPVSPFRAPTRRMAGARRARSSTTLSPRTAERTTTWSARASPPAAAAARARTARPPHRRCSASTA
jgi:hypothetical protein